MQAPDLFAPSDEFVRRHLGPRRAQIQEMLGSLGFNSLNELIVAVIPKAIRFEGGVRSRA